MNNNEKICRRLSDTVPFKSILRLLVFTGTTRQLGVKTGSLLSLNYISLFILVIYMQISVTLQELGLDYLDCWMIHAPWAFVPHWVGHVFISFSEILELEILFSTYN